MSGFVDRCSRRSKFFEKSQTIKGREFYSRVISITTVLFVGIRGMSEAKLSLHDWCQTGDLAKVREYINGEGKDSLTEQVAAISVSSGQTPLHEAAASGNPHIVSLILDRARELGKNVINIKSRSGFTALHLAANLNNRDCAEVLLTNGADASIVDLDGKIPLQYVKSGNEDILCVFWNHGK